MRFSRITALRTAIIVKVIICLLLLVLLTVTANRSFLDSTFVDKTVAEVTDDTVSVDSTEDTASNVVFVYNEEERLQDTEIFKSYENAKKLNGDVVGWIKIQGTMIDYPVMHSTEPDFYLDHDSEKQASKNGSIYLDSAQNGWGLIDIIHGHNLKSGKMFGQLVKYKDEAFAKEHLYIEMIQDGKLKTYKIFSVFLADGNKDTFPIQFADYSEYRNHYEILKARSMFDLGTDVTSDNIIMLNTCSYEFDNAHFIVCAQLMEG